MNVVDHRKRCIGKHKEQFTMHLYYYGTPVVSIFFLQIFIIDVTKYYFNCMEYVKQIHERRCVAQ